MTPLLATDVLPSSAAADEVCAVCGGRAFTRGVHGCLSQCRACGYLWYPLNDELQPAALYNADYFRGAEYFDYPAQRRTMAKNFARHVQWMRRYGARGGRLFEVGCAHGFFLHEARRCFEAAGVDVSPEAAAFAQRRLGLSVQCGEFATWEPRGTYDVVCAWETIEHVFDPAACVRKIHAMLRAGGYLFLTAPDIGSLLARWQGRRWRQIHPPTHVNYFTASTMTRLLERLGFEVLGVRHVGAYREVNNMLLGISLFSKRPGIRAAARWLLARTQRWWGHADIYINTFDMMFVAARKQTGNAP